MSETNVVYYPRRMRVGWCVAHTVRVMGVVIERYGQRAATYPEACRLAESMNKQTGNGHNKKTE